MKKRPHPNPRIVIVSLNNAPEMVGIGKYNQSMAQGLAAQDLEVNLLTSQAYFPVWDFFDRQPWVTKKGRLTQIRVSPAILKVGGRVSALTRIAFELSFLSKAILPLVVLLIVRRPRFVFFTSPPLFASLFLSLLVRVFGVPTHFHHQDLQLEASRVVLKNSDSTVFRFLTWLDRASFHAFSSVSTISEGMKAVMDRKTQKVVHLVPNWADPEAIDLVTEIEEKFRRNDIVYSGSIGAKQGLEVALDAAKQLGATGLVLHIYGQGDNRSNLETYAIEHAIDNVEFHDLLPYEQFLGVLGSCFLQLIVQKEEIQDSVLPSKLNNIVASGTPMIVAATETTFVGRMVKEHTLGLLYRPGDSDQLARQILALRSDFATYSAISTSQRQYSAIHLTRSASLRTLLEIPELRKGVRR